MELHELAKGQREFYQTGRTLNYAFRAQALDSLAKGLARWEDRLLQALEADLGKPPFETYMTEIGLVKSELRWQRAHLRVNMRPRPVPTPLAQFKARSFQDPHPYGVVLEIAPWNYPLLLSLTPLAGALAAGNCVVVKLSDQAPNAAQAVVGLLADCFDPRHVFGLQGGRAENQALLAQRFDKIFFTGYGSGRAGSGGQTPDAGRIRAGRQKPVYRHGGGQPASGGSAHCLRQIPQ